MPEHSDNGSGATPRRDKPQWRRGDARTDVCVEAPAMAEEAAAQPVAKKPGKKTAIMILSVLILEAVVIVGAMKFLGGGPAPVHASDVAEPAHESEDDKIVETEVLKAKMPNNKSGVTYIYDTEIYVQVKKRHADRVKAEVEQFQNEIKADITAIWRTAEPQSFQDPRLEKLPRTVYALLDERFGAGADGDPIVTKCVIVMSTGFRIDS
jgi:flagellar basal body-associated protein FliL